MTDRHVSDGITEEQLAEWRRIEKAATAGPWESEWDKQDRVPDPHGENQTIVTSCADVPAVDRPIVGVFLYDGAPMAGCTRENSAFIAAARTAVPALLAEVRRLRSAFDDMKGRALEAAEAADRDQ